MPVIGHVANNGHLSLIYKLGQNFPLLLSLVWMFCADLFEGFCVGYAPGTPAKSASEMARVQTFFFFCRFYIPPSQHHRAFLAVVVCGHLFGISPQ